MRVRSSLLTTVPSTISSTRIPGTTSPVSTMTSRRSAPFRLATTIRHALAAGSIAVTLILSVPTGSTSSSGAPAWTPSTSPRFSSVGALVGSGGVGSIGSTGADGSVDGDTATGGTATGVAGAEAPLQATS